MGSKRGSTCDAIQILSDLKMLAACLTECFLWQLLNYKATTPKQDRAVMG